MTYCTACGTPREVDGRFCTGCGEQVNAAPSARSHSRRRIVVVLSALALLVSGGVAAWTMSAHGTSPSALPSRDTLPTQSQAISTGSSRNAPALLSAASVSASSHSGRGHDASGTWFTYEPEKAVDNIPETAWRCDGDGRGQWLEIDFRDRVTLTGIGIIPGFAKTDAEDRTDRYAQNRRISAVEYSFDDGSSVVQRFDTSAFRREMQTMMLSNISTKRVRITILDSVLGEDNHGRSAFNQVAISEVTVLVP